MNTFTGSLFVLLFIFKIIGDVDCECLLSLKKDFRNPAPVFLRNKKYLSPDASGTISVPRSGLITVACPGANRFVVLNNSTTSYNVVEAHCINNSTFRVDRWIGTFDQIKCSRSPDFETLKTSRSCYNGGTVYEMGYKVNTVFYSLYESCFSEDVLTTHYVKHELLPTSIFIQIGSSRPDFLEGDLFRKVQMKKLYKIENQKSRLDSILGAGMSQNYITKKQFMTRGHLAARADFTLRAEMRATFHYANAAPQFQRGNAGDWAALEDALRRRVQRLGRSVTVFTGTYGVLSLPDSTGRLQPIYLHTDENNNGIVPVPLYFYKLVYDKKSKTATAFVTINSSFYNNTEVKNLTFCDDVCTESELSWLSWRPDDGTDSFCCDYEDFKQKIGILEDLDVVGLFY